MQPPPSSALQSLRAELDRLDDAAVDLLVQRFGIVHEVARVKGDRGRGGLALRPAREAQIIRRLVARTAGKFPAPTLVRIWRELLAATTGLQTPYIVAVPRQPDAAGPSLADVARDHFGSITPLRRVEGASMAVTLLQDGQVQLALLPMPDPKETWWRSLVLDPERQVRVVSRVPFLVTKGSPTALVLAILKPEPSGDDLSLLAIDAHADLSLARLQEVLEAQGMAATAATSFRPSGEAATHLLEVAGFLDDQEPSLTSRLAALRPHLHRVTVLGSYPRPLALTEAG